VASFFFTFLKIYLNGQRWLFVYVWFGANDLIASFGPLSDGGFDRLFSGRVMGKKPISERAGLVGKQAYLRRFKVKVELGRLDSPVTIFPRGIP